MRPILRPGSHVLRRHNQEIQVGLDPRHAVVLSDDCATRSCLAKLGRFADVSEYGAAHILDLLDEHGLLLDGSALAPLVPCQASRPDDREEPPSRRPPRQDIAALARSYGDEAAALLDARMMSRAEVVAFADIPGDRLATELAEMLREVGFPARRPTGRAAGSTPPHGSHDDPTSSGTAVTMAALVGVGEPDRALVDGWMRARTPHVLVRLTEGFATVGPFVDPGRTACLRCLDAHHTDADPSWPLLVAQYSALTRRDRADGIPEPVDGLLARMVLAWAARDLTSYAERRRPSTWSATIRLDPQLGSVETRSWLRHPDCGCAWA